MSTPQEHEVELTVAFTPQQLVTVGAVIALFILWRRLAAQGR